MSICQPQTRLDIHSDFLFSKVWLELERKELPPTPASLSELEFTFHDGKHWRATAAPRYLGELLGEVGR